MADTVTPKLGLIKPEIGASNNTWGTKWNGNVDIIESKMVRQTIQWRITAGDDNPASATGPWTLTRIGNNGLDIDNPITVNRQTGDVTLTGKLTATGEITSSAKSTFNKVYSTQAIISGSGNVTIPPAALAVANFSYVGGHFSMVSNDGVSYNTYNLYYDGSFKNYKVGYSGYMYYHADNGNYTFSTTPNSLAANAVTNAAPILVVAPTGISVTGTLSATGAITGASATISGAASVSGALTVAGVTTLGQLNAGDIYATRSPTEGVLFFGNGSQYIHFASGAFHFSGAPLSAMVGSANFSYVVASSAVQAPVVRLPHTTNPGPVGGVGTVWVDTNGNPCYTRQDGSVQFLGVPPGTIAWTAASTPDVGWAICNGQPVNRAANPQLNFRIGLLYGGDATNLLLPDIRARVIAGVDNNETQRLINTLGGANLGAVGGFDYHYLSAAQLPQHRHYASVSGTTNSMNRSNPHNHGVTGGIWGGTTIIGRPQSSVNDAYIPLGHSNVTISNSDINHEHTFGGAGWTDYGEGVNNGWHPNVQPTICLTAQIKLG